MREVIKLFAAVPLFIGPSTGQMFGSVLALEIVAAHGLVTVPSPGHSITRNIAEFEWPMLQNFNFVHIPKNAGTSVYLFGLQNNVVWGEERLVIPKRIPSRCRTKLLDKVKFPYTRRKEEGAIIHGECNSWHIPPCLRPKGRGDTTLQQPGARGFAFVRDPFDRIVSEARFRHVPCNGLMDSYIRRELTKVAEGSYFRNDCHFVPQADYFVHKNGTLIDGLMPICFEDLAEVMNQVFPGKTFNVHKWGHHHGCSLNMSVETTALIKKHYAHDFKMREVLCPMNRLEVKHRELTSELSRHKEATPGIGIGQSGSVESSAHAPRINGRNLRMISMKRRDHFLCKAVDRGRRSGGDGAPGLPA